MSALETAPREAPSAPGPPPTAHNPPDSPLSTIIVLARRFALAVGLLVPIAVELQLRSSEPKRWLEVGIVYLAAVVAFSWLGPAGAPLVQPAPGPPIRWPLIVAALLLVALGTRLGLNGPTQPILFPIWLAGVIAWLLAWLPLRPSRPRLGARLWPMLTLVAVAAGLRFYRLEQWPLQLDELFVAEDVIRRLQERMSLVWPTFFFDHKAGLPNTQMAVSVYTRLVAYSLFGIDMWSLRVVSALQGVAEVALLFPIAALLFGRRVAFVATATLATLGVHITFSRYGQENTESSMLWTVAAGLLALGFARRSVAWMALTGLSLAACLQTYPSGHVAPAFVLAALLMAALDPALRGRWLTWGALAVVAGLAVGMGPLIATYYRDTRVFHVESELASWLPHAVTAFRTTYDPSALWPLWDHLVRAVLGHNMVPAIEYNYRPGRAMFLSVPAALLFSGLAFVSLRLRDWRHRLLALWFWAPTIGLSWLSDDPPAPHRALAALPASAILIALAYEKIVLTWGALGRPIRRWASVIGGAVLVPFMIVEAAFNVGDYSLFDPDPWQNAVIRSVVAMPPGRSMVFIDGTLVVSKGLEFTTVYGERSTWDHALHALAQLPETRDRPHGLTYFISHNRAFPFGVHVRRPADQAAWIELLREVYPTGRTSELRTSDLRGPGALLWTVLELDAEAIEHARGLHLVATDARGKRIERREPAVVLSEPLPADTTYPVELEWRGWLHRERFADPDRLVSLGTVAPRLWFGDAVVQLPAVPGQWMSAPLPPGPMPLRATARLAEPADTVRVQWDGFLRRDLTYEIEPRFDAPFPRVVRDLGVEQVSVWPGEPRVRVDWLAADGRLLRRDYDATIADRTFQWRRPGVASELVRLSGEIDVAQRGSYEFVLETDGAARLLIDGREVSPVGDRPGEPDPRRAPAWLEAGRHTIVVELGLRGGGSATLLWRPPGRSTQSVMPPGAFVPIAWP